MASAPDFLQWIKKEEDDSDSQLWRLSQEIWNHPELKFEEHRAHQVLTDYLEDKGFRVYRNYTLPTAFKAELSLSGNGFTGPSLALLCEYDALPLIGHSCGHNLIAESSLAAALALKEFANRRGGIPGKLVVLGTPAEEGGGGKIQMIKKGAFDNLDAVLMAHPCGGQNVTSTPTFITSFDAEIEYRGKASHAAGKPWEGLNALDAAVACYVNVALLKQQLKPGWKVNGIITRGGEATNVIPRDTALSYLLRTPDSRDTKYLADRFQKCVEASGEATGCQSKCTFNWNTHYKHVVQNKAIAELYKKHAQELGTKFLDGESLTVSTDFGNVSHLVPGIHPCFGLGTNSFPHTEEFGVAAGSRDAQEPTLKVAAALAATAADLFLDKKLLSRVRQVHNETTGDLQQDLY